MSEHGVREPGGEPPPWDRSDQDEASRSGGLDGQPASVWPPAFSDRYVETVRERFDHAGQLAIVGPLGSNRGLLATLVTDAPERGAVWWRSDASRVRSRQPYAALNHVLSSLSAQPSDSLDDVVTAAVEHLKSQHAGPDRPTVILREADLGDSDSIHVLTELANRGHIKLVTTAGSEFLARVPSRSEVVRLEPLDSSVISYLLEHRFAAQAHPLTVAMLAARSQGAYGVLKEIAEIEYAAGRIAIIAGVLMPTVLAAAGSEMLEESVLPPDHLRHAGREPNDLLDIAALVEILDLAETRSTFGSDALDALITLGVAHVSGGAVIFTSTAEASLMQRAIDVKRRRELYNRYFEGLKTSCAGRRAAVPVANWLMSIDVPLDVSLAVHASTAANRQGRYGQAMRFIRAIDFDQRPAHLLVEEAHALTETGAAETVAALVEAVDLTTIPDIDLVPLLFWSQRHLAPDEFGRRYQRLRDHAKGDVARLGAMEVFEQIESVHSTGEERLGDELQSLVQSDHLASVNRGVALTLYAVWARASARADIAVAAAQQAKEIFETDPQATAYHLEWATEIAVLSCLANADLPSAERMLTDYSASGAQFGAFGRLGMALWGAYSYYSGDIRSALANFTMALSSMPASDPHDARAWCEAVLAQAVAQTGELEQVDKLVSTSTARPIGTALVFELERRISEACAYDSAGDPDTALDRLADVIDAARENQLRLCEVDAAVLSVQIGGPGFNWLLLRATERLEHAAGTAEIWKRFAVAIRDNKMSQLVDLAVELDGAGADVFAAEVAQFTLDVARRASDMSAESRDKLQQIADPMAHRHVAR